MSRWRVFRILVRMHLAVCWNGTDASWMASTIPRNTVPRQNSRPRDGLH